MKKFLFVFFAASLAACQTTISTPLSNFPLINSGPPPACVVSQPFNFTLTSIGGILPVTYSTVPACPGATCWLPPGCTSSLNTANGAINCTPTTSGTYSGQFAVTDSVGNSSSTQSSILCTNPLVINPTTCPAATVSSAYAGCTPSATGGIPPYTWIQPSGLPTGISQTSSSTGALGGTPTGSVGLYNFTFTVKDSGTSTATSPSSIQLNSAAPTCGPNGAISYACSAFCTGVAGCPVVSYPAPPFTSNSALGAIAYDTSLNPSGTDPIVRATDPTLASASFVISPTGGSNGDNMFSSDDTIFMVIEANQSASVAIGFNPATQQILSSGAQTPVTNAGGTYFFAHQTPKVLYQLTTGGSTTNHPKVYKTTFTTNVNPSNPANYTQVLVFDPITTCAALSGLALTGGSITLDLNDTDIHLGLVTTGQNSIGYAVDYTISNGHCTTLYTGSNTNNLNINGVVSTATFPCAPFGLHNTNMFADGVWSRISVGAIGTCSPGAIYYKINTTTVFSCGPGLGHNANGYNVEVIVSNPHWFFGDVTGNQTTFCNNVNGAQTYGDFPYVSVPGDAENHFSATYIDTADTFPITGGSAWANWPGNPFATSCSPGSCAGISEVYAIQRSPYHWIRFTHSFTSGSVLCSDCDFRTINNITATSQTGKFIAFSSDMLLSLGTDGSNKHRQDVFVVKAQ